MLVGEQPHAVLDEGVWMVRRQDQAGNAPTGANSTWNRWSGRGVAISRLPDCRNDFVVHAVDRDMCGSYSIPE
jgi:hypothetical protein